VLYLDSSYVAKCYLNDADCEAVRALVRRETRLFSSYLCVGEVSFAFHRRYRERALTRRQMGELAGVFRSHVEAGFWNLIPLTEGLLWQVHESLWTLPVSVFVRSADAIHLVSAREAGFQEIWTNDRHMLAAASHYRLKGRSV